MLENSFYTIIRQDTSPGNVKALLSINKDHKILQGHFPGQPVVPGVCMVQIVKELLERQTNKKLLLNEADNIKFLSVMDPGQYPLVEATVSFAEEGKIFFLTASLTSGEIVFFKLKAILQHTQ